MDAQKTSIHAVFLFFSASFWAIPCTACDFARVYKIAWML